MNTNSNHVDEHRRQKYRKTAENLEPLEKYTIEEYKFDPPELNEFDEKMKKYVGPT